MNNLISSTLDASINLNFKIEICSYVHKNSYTFCVV